MNFRRRSIRWLLPALLLGCLNLTAPAMAAGGLEQARTQLEQGRQLMAQGDYQKAAVLTRAAREAFEQLKASGGNTGNGLARAMMQLAHLQVLLGQTEPAHALASQSLGSLDNANDPALMAELLLEMGEINFLMGHSVAALSYAQMVLTQMPSMPAAAEKIRVLSRISRLYYLWGRLDMALARLKEALQLAADSGSALACELYLQRGEIELGLGQQAAAKADVEQAQALIAREPDRARQGELLLRLAQAYQGLDAPEPAAQAYRQALALLQELPLPASQALYGLGELRRASGQYAQALDFYRQALARVKHLEHNLYLGPYYSALGQTLLAQGQLQPAIENLETAVNFLKQFDDAAADTQREYYEKLAPAFEALSQAYVRAGDADKALEIVENTRGLFFFQMLWQAKHGGDTKGSVFSAGWNANVYWFRESFPEDTTLLNYAVPASGPLLQFRLQDRQLSAQESDIEAQLRKDPLYQSLPPGPESGLTRLIKAYRQQLITPGGDQLQLKQMSQLLYRLLIGPHEAQLKGHHTLLIAPDGELGLLPFETLRNAAGEYLIENFDVQYIQSLSILKELEARNYAPERKPMLALGAPEYQEIAFEREPVESADQLLELKKLMWLHPDGDMREIYGALYSPQWEPLPGTSDELAGIAKALPASELISGEQVEEAAIKQRSAAGELAAYKVLHFATHGLSVPELPELSALVLSQFSDKQAEDGYLRLPEIINLKLQADFVNLSACETGLGKVFRGEGVVGLTQAFLAAGANQVSVSLWQINDQSSAKLMQALYQPELQANGSYARAMNAVKRRFLAGEFGEAYRHPYYWSPFVVYGRL